MSFRILIVAATPAEAAALRRIPGLKSDNERFTFEKNQIDLLITGVGSVSTSWSMIKWFSANQRPDLAINIGIAGSYRNDIPVGEVVVPVSDCFADAGIETENSFLTLSEAGLQDPDNFPFKEGKIIADNEYVGHALTQLRSVRAITVNTATGSEQGIMRLLKKYNPDIETMEGATFFYICCREKIPFLAIRSISNIVEPRNKDKWNIQAALENLSERLRDFLLTFR